MKLLLSVILATSTFVSPIVAYPSFAQFADKLARDSGSDSSSTSGTLQSTIYVPPPPKDTSSKQIPDALHPYIAPGPLDQRGPCPGLNTLANHGYLPRGGIALYADIVNAVQEGFNMGYDLATAITGYALITRGNPLLGLLSIGGESILIPPVPGNLDGTPGGIAKHGRFEGDVSFTRVDAAIGDNRRFNQSLFDTLLSIQKQYSTDQYVTPLVLHQSKAERFNYSMTHNPTFSYHNVRETFSFGEASFMLTFFANGTEGKLSVPTMTSFFQKETFPPNWHRHDGAANITQVTNKGLEVALPDFPIPGGKNSAGVYVNDAFDPSDPCQLYKDLISNVPAALVGPSADPQTKANTNAMLAIIKGVVGGPCPTAIPSATKE